MDLTYPEKYFKAAAFFDYVFGDIEETDALSGERKLLFYALRCQAEKGACSTAPPSRWHRNEWYKYNAWKKLATLSKEEAMVHFVNELEKEIEQLEPYLSEEIRSLLSSPIRWADVELGSREGDDNVSNANHTGNDNNNNNNNDDDGDDDKVKEEKKGNAITATSGVNVDTSPNEVENETNVNVNTYLMSTQLNNINENTNVIGTKNNDIIWSSHTLSSSSLEQQKAAAATAVETEENEFTITTSLLKKKSHTALDICNMNDNIVETEFNSSTELPYEFSEWDEDIREHYKLTQANLYYLATELMHARLANSRMLDTIHNLHDELDERNNELYNVIVNNSTSHANRNDREYNQIEELSNLKVENHLFRTRYSPYKTEKLVIRTISPFAERVDGKEKLNDTERLQVAEMNDNREYVMREAESPVIMEKQLTATKTTTTQELINTSNTATMVQSNDNSELSATHLTETFYLPQSVNIVREKNCNVEISNNDNNIDRININNANRTTEDNNINKFQGDIITDKNKEDEDEDEDKKELQEGEVTQLKEISFAPERTTLHKKHSWWS